MASSLTISSIVIFFRLSSLFFPAARADLSGGVNGGGGSGDGLLKIACNVPGNIAWFPTDPWDYNLCNKVLKSYPNVASSRDLPTLAMNIINAGISNASNTYAYIQSVLKRPKSIRPSLVKALEGCSIAYKEQVLEDLRGALSYIKDDKDYDNASDNLLMVRRNDISNCQDELAKVRDQTISSGNNFVILFSATADAVCRHIMRSS